MTNMKNLVRETDNHGTRYAYRGWLIRSTDAGWTIAFGAGRCGDPTGRASADFDGEYRKVVATRKTRRAAAEYIDRRALNASKAA